MPTRRSILSCLALAAVAGGPSLAQQPPPVAPPPVSPPRAVPPQPPVAPPPPLVARPEAKPADDKAAEEDPSGISHVLPELTLESARLEDVVEQLQTAQPRFRAVIVRDADVPVGYPTLTLKVRNVSIGQVMELVTTSFPGVATSEIAGPKGSLIVLKVSNQGQPGVPGGGLFGGDGGGGGGGPGGMVGGGQGPTVRVYRLTPLVEQVVAARGQVAPKDALNSVLSLLKAALTQADNPREQVVLQVHEETQTLVFRGTAAQQRAVEQVIAALTPADGRDPKAVAELKDRVRSLENELQQQAKLRAIEAEATQAKLKEAEVAAAEARQGMVQREIELERMRLRLEAAAAKRAAEAGAPPKQ